MSKTPTAEELFEEYHGFKADHSSNDILQLMIEFAKLHLQAQKEAIRKELEEGLETFGVSLTDDFKLEQTGNNLLDNAYPLNNIK
jgi:C4-dicarboxylate-specific signal transduction histidine kinase